MSLFLHTIAKFHRFTLYIFANLTDKIGIQMLLFVFLILVRWSAFRCLLVLYCFLF